MRRRKSLTAHEVRQKAKLQRQKEEEPPQRVRQVTSITRRGSGPGHAGNRAGDAAPPGRSATEPAEAALVLEIWQELVDATLSPGLRGK